MSKEKRKRRPTRKQVTATTRIVIPESASAERGYLRAVTIGLFCWLAVIFAGGLLNSIGELSVLPASAFIDTQGHHNPLGPRFRTVIESAAELEQAQAQARYEVVSPLVLHQQLAAVRIEIDTHKRKQALADITKLEKQIKSSNSKLASHIQQQSVALPASGGETLTVPILIYHYTPADFDGQLAALERKHYSAITLDRLDAALHRQGQLPAKPVILTFDDGFANQMSAFNILKKHNMPATYYIINAGERSRWCIGAGRRSGDPLQPSSGCGDAYLTWDQVRELDRSGLITIASHTVDHENLATQTAAEQEFQIAEGKRGLEAEIGHPILHFAYPYGGYTATTIGLVKKAGFLTAVSTLPGSQHSLESEYNLHRVRDAYNLP